MNLWVIFLTGLTVGGLTCLAVQGGLLASVIAAREDSTHTKTSKHAIVATFAFLIAKLLGYTALGFVLGAFGGAINISGSVQSYMQILAGIYMIAVALNLLNIHPIFRYVIIQPPRFLTRIVRNQSKSKDIFAPAFLGAMTIFIPCGTTIAMEALAISSANPFVGASILGAFVLGTIPLFFGIGLVTSFLGDAFKSRFLKLAAIAVIYLGLTSVSGAFNALGVSFGVSSQTPVANSSVEQTNQNPEIVITSSGYSPNYIRVKKDQPVVLTLTNQGAYTCASAFRIPSLKIATTVSPNQSQTITFTPKETGKILFSCSMGMYRGIIEVI